MALTPVHSLVGNPAVLKQVNRVRLLRLLRLGGAMSRAELARQSGLDAKTITNIVTQLLDDAAVVLRDAVSAGRGRPAAEVALNPDYGCALGVDVGAQQVTVVMTHFDGSLGGQQRHDFGCATDIETLLATVETMIAQQLAAMTDTQRRRLKGIGITFPGLLDRQTGRIISCVNIPRAVDVPVTERLQQRFDYPIILEEASRSMARAEIWFSQREPVDNFIVVDVGYGIGLGIVIDGRLFRGTNEKGGEVGHINVAADGIRCRCGKVGCLETVASGHALALRAEQLPLSDYGIDHSDAKAVFILAHAGHAQARHLLDQAAEALGIAVANVINLFDPGQIIFSGQLVMADDTLWPGILAAIEHHTLASTYRRTTVMKTHLGCNNGALGAAMLALLDYFQVETVRL